MVLFILLGFAAAVGSYAQDTSAEVRFAHGNQAFVGGNLDEAVRQYRSVQDQAGLSPGLLYNLANVHREKNEVGHAIVNYERALWLTPRDPDILAGLATTRKDAALFPEPVPRWVAPFRRGSLTEWTWLAAGSWGLLGLAFLARGLGLKRAHARTLIVISAITLLVGAGGTAYHIRQLDRAVVIATDAPLLVSPYEAARRAASIREGKVLRVMDSHGDFVKVASTAGQTGWMNAINLTRIVPEAGESEE